MTDYQQIHTFAMKWLDRFRDPAADFMEFVDLAMGDDCKKLGFQMDCGDAFMEQYGKAFDDVEQLDHIIGDVSDIGLLGSAIFSKWRYFNHWAYNGAEILEYENRAWFLIALGRLAVLTGKDPFFFSGTLKKIKLVSNNIGFGLLPAPEEEVEQHVTIHKDGRVWITRYLFGTENGRYQKKNTEQFRIDAESAASLMDLLSGYFGSEHIQMLATDIGDWKLEMTNEEGRTYTYRGSLCSEIVVQGTDLSDLIRNILNRQTLFAFDGNHKPDEITRIHVNYLCRETGSEDNIQESTESLLLDRATDSLEYRKVSKRGAKTSIRIEGDNQIRDLLDYFDADEALLEITGNPEEAIQNPLIERTYVMTLDYKKKERLIHSGSFDKLGLPKDWEAFIDLVLTIMKNCGKDSDLLSHKLARRRKLFPDEYIYLRVCFSEGGKSYYYRTKNETIQEGDFVVVEVGNKGKERIVCVKAVEYYHADDVPYPLEKTNSILRKCTDEDFERILYE